MHYVTDKWGSAFQGLAVNYANDCGGEGKCLELPREIFSGGKVFGIVLRALTSYSYVAMNLDKEKILSIRTRLFPNSVTYFVRAMTYLMLVCVFNVTLGLWTETAHYTALIIVMMEDFINIFLSRPSWAYMYPKI